MESCARTNTIAALLAGAVDPVAAERLEVHLDACSACRQLVADLGRGLSAIGGGAPSGLAQGLPRPGESLGRYEILCVIGVGGMGVVYEAHDTTLDRRVAIKLLRPDLLEGPSLLAEAQAMAKLQHPNIATVHDAGIANGQLYVCMEFVAGTTLRAWRERGKDWRAIVDAYRAAGEGLAYVHRAGLVHLDFKPDNVLIDPEGRVRVTDFGLARIVGARPTRTAGVIVGTPAYMAPEQRRGIVPDARADQYAFCVSLREALDLSDVPRAFHDVIDRGLADHPDDRYASMDELLAALAHARAPGRRRLAALAVFVAGTAATATVSWLPGSAAVVTKTIERPVAHTVIEYRDRGVEAPPSPAGEPRATPVLAASVADPLARIDGRSGPSGFTPPRRPPVLHLDSLVNTVSFAGAASGAFADDTGQTPPGIGASYCDDGSTLSCGWWAPSCPTGTVLAIQQGCWTCADEQTCGPLGFPRTCNDGSPLRCTLEPPTCGAHRIASIRNGCWSCEDVFACSTWIKTPSYPPPRPPPRPQTPNNGSNASPNGSGAGSGGGGSGGGGSGGGGSGGGATCGNGFCEVGESHAVCAGDCCETDSSGACLATCGNGFCENGESHASCASDCCELTGSGACAPVCGNGFCEDGETAASCPSEC
jgi:uncharacterized membrane protein YgcG